MSLLDNDGSLGGIGGAEGLRGLLLLALLVFMAFSWSRSESIPVEFVRLGPMRSGVVAPESPEDGLSVHIILTFSRSLSDSSLLLLVLERRVRTEVARGLRSGVSAMVRGAREARRLGRRRRDAMNWLRSSCA